MSNFNFRKVQETMTFLGWKWYFPGEPSMRVPGEYDLRKCALTLLQEAWEKGTSIETGGFQASYDNNTLSLNFILEQWETL